MHHNSHFVNIVAGPPRPQPIKPRNAITVLEYYSFVPIKRQSENVGVASVPADDERKPRVDGEGLVAESELRRQRPQISDGPFDFGFRKTQRMWENE